MEPVSVGIDDETPSNTRVGAKFVARWVIVFVAGFALYFGALHPENHDIFYDEQGSFKFGVFFGFFAFVGALIAFRMAVSKLARDAFARCRNTEPKATDLEPLEVV